MKYKVRRNSCVYGGLTEPILRADLKVSNSKIQRTSAFGDESYFQSTKCMLEKRRKNCDLSNQPLWVKST